MLSSSPRGALIFFAIAATTALAARAQGQQKARGFAVERLYTSPPGSTWLVMDDLGMQKGLGGALALTTGYARNPLQIADGVDRLAVVSNQTFTNFGMAVTYNRWRLSLGLSAPLVIEGHSGMVGAVHFAAPGVTLSSNPDTLADPRVGVEARIIGEASSPFRLGLGAELIAPNGAVADYDTDGTFRGVIRAMVAGDHDRLSYASQLGVHIRPRDDPDTPGGPRGSELLVGVAGCSGLSQWNDGARTLSVSAELYGATAFRSFFGATTTALEGLLEARFDAAMDHAHQIRMKVGAGPGLDQNSGAPEWRVVFAIELLGHTSPHAK